jgi:hypothetical protein
MAYDVSLIIASNISHGPIGDGGFIEVVDAWDEWQIDGNESGFAEALKKAREKPYYGIVKVVTVTLDYEDIERHFVEEVPTTKVIAVKVDE